MFKKITAALMAAALAFGGAALLPQSTVEDFSAIEATAYTTGSDMLQNKLSGMTYANAVSFAQSYENGKLYFEKNDAAKTIVFYATDLRYTNGSVSGISPVIRAGDYLIGQQADYWGYQMVGYAGSSTDIYIPDYYWDENDGYYSISGVGPYTAKVTVKYNNSGSYYNTTFDTTNTAFLFTDASVKKADKVNITLDDYLDFFGTYKRGYIDEDGEYELLDFSFDSREAGKAKYINVLYNSGSSIADFINEHRDMYVTDAYFQLIEIDTDAISGDIDGDGMLSYIDVAMLISIVNSESKLSLSPYRLELAKGLDGDEIISYGDVAVLINMINAEAN